MNTSESTPAIVDLEGRGSPARSGRVVLSVFGILIGTLLFKTFPALTPIWLGPIVIAAVVADILSVRFVRKMRSRFSKVTVYRLTLPKGVTYVADDSRIKSLITFRALFLPVAVACFVAFLTAGFFLYRFFVAYGAHVNPAALRSHGSPVALAIAGIFAAVLLSRAVLSWRLTQAIFRNAGLPHVHIPASTTFILSFFLSLYILGDFGRTAYEALKPVPPPKTIGDLVHSSLSAKGTFVIEHRESLTPNAQVQREIYFVDPKAPSGRTLLFGYQRAATVRFSPDESWCIISEKRDGFVRPVFMVSTASLRGGAMGLVHQMRTGRDTLDARLRNFYTAFSNGAAPPGNIWTGAWSPEGDAVIFALEVAKEKSAAETSKWLCVWDYKEDLFTKVDAPATDQQTALKSFLAEKGQKAQETNRQRVSAAVHAKVAVENRRDTEGIVMSYTPISTYRGKGYTSRDAIQAERTDEFRLWKESKETVVGEIEIAPAKEGRWRARWKTNAELHSPERRETLTQERAYDCEFLDQKGQLVVTTETFEVLKGETKIEPAAPPPQETPKPQVTLALPITPPPIPPTPKPLKFPEGTWVIHRQERNAQENIVWNNVLTVRGTAFQYDVAQTHDLIDPVNNPWTQANALKGVTRYNWTKRFTGKIIRSDANTFVVKITDEALINVKPKGLGVDAGIGFSKNRLWVFMKTRGGGIADKNDPNTAFQSVDPSSGKEESGGR